jgi:hypothetical protein
MPAHKLASMTDTQMSLRFMNFLVAIFWRTGIRRINVFNILNWVAGHYLRCTRMARMNILEINLEKKKGQAKFDWYAVGF